MCVALTTLLTTFFLTNHIDIHRIYQLAAETSQEKERWLKELNVILNSKNAPSSTAAASTPSPVMSPVTPTNTAERSGSASGIQLGASRPSLGSTAQSTANAARTDTSSNLGSDSPGAPSSTASNTASSLATIETVPLVQFQAVFSQLCTRETLLPVALNKRLRLNTLSYSICNNGEPGLEGQSG